DGGSGDGDVTFAVSVGCECSNGGVKLRLITGSGLCTITTLIPCTALFRSKTSAPETVAAKKAEQAALSVTGVPAVAQAYDSTFTVGSSGGSGSGGVSFAASGACENTLGGSLIRINAGSGTCSVTATTAADA